MTAFTVTWDYRCPFARNAHEHVVEALRDGTDWDVRFSPFSLAQAHVADDETDVWSRPDDDTGLAALQVAVVVRDTLPERFPDVHLALFALRHDEGKRLNEIDQLRRVLKEQGVDPDPVFAAVAEGTALDTVREEHTAGVENHQVWGVPTFIVDDAAAFVRLMDRPNGDRAHARRSIDRILHLLTDAPELNEFKHTTVKR